MRIKDIPVGSAALTDANILVYANQQKSKECMDLVTRCADLEITVLLTTHIFSEIMHALMLNEARSRGLLTGNNPARKLSEKPTLIQSLTDYQNKARKIITAGFIIEPVVREDFFSALTIQKQYGLLTNDSLLIAAAHRLGIKAIASADKAFRNIPSIDLYEPGDL